MNGGGAGTGPSGPAGTGPGRQQPDPVEDYAARVAADMEPPTRDEAIRILGPLGLLADRTSDTSARTA